MDTDNSNIAKKDRVVSWDQAGRALLLSVPLFIVFLIVSTVIVIGIVVLAGLTGQGGRASNPSNTEFFNSAFDYVKVFGFITFLSSLAVLRGICLCIGAMCKETYGKAHVVFFILSGILAIALLLLMLYFSYVHPAS